MVHGGIPSISLPGDDIPKWFPYINEGCDSIRFQVPDQLLNYTLKSFVVNAHTQETSTRTSTQSNKKKQ